jgi:hypothetical protein
MEWSENKTKKKQKTAIIFALKRNGSEKLPSFSLLSKIKRNESEKLPSFLLRSKMEANFFALMRKNEIKRKQNEQEAKTSKRKSIKSEILGQFVKNRRKLFRLVFYFFMSIPSMVKRSEKTFILFRFEAKQSEKTFISFCFEAKRKDRKQNEKFLEAKQSENTLY